MSDVQMVLQQVQENEVMVFIFAAAGLLLIGFWLGYAVRRWSWEPRRKQRACFNEAPTPYVAPQELYRARTAGASASRTAHEMAPLRRETVQICGATWYRMN